MEKKAFNSSVVLQRLLYMYQCMNLSKLHGYMFEAGFCMLLHLKSENNVTLTAKKDKD